MGRTTLDTVSGLTLRQPKEGYRFSMDPVFLASFVSSRSPKSIVDLGSGSGIIGLLLARRYEKARVTLVELEADLYSHSRHNIGLNSFEDRVEAVQADIRRLPEGIGPCDLVVSNPPFRRPGTGRVSKWSQRASARHELGLRVDELCSVAAGMLRARGRFCVAYHPERLAELLDTLRGVKLEPKRMRFVHGRAGLEARIVLVESALGAKAGLKVEPPLIVYESGSQQYTPEVRAMYE